MEICKNCKFSRPVQDDEEFIKQQIKLLDEKIEKEQANLKAGELFAAIENKRHFQARLADMSEMIWCHRYPTPDKKGINHWCGEFKSNFFTM